MASAIFQSIPISFRIKADSICVILFHQLISITRRINETKRNRFIIKISQSAPTCRHHVIFFFRTGCNQHPVLRKHLNDIARDLIRRDAFVACHGTVRSNPRNFPAKLSRNNFRFFGYEGNQHLRSSQRLRCLFCQVIKQIDCFDTEFSILGNHFCFGFIQSRLICYPVFGLHFFIVTMKIRNVVHLHLARSIQTVHHQSIFDGSTIQKETVGCR